LSRHISRAHLSFSSPDVAATYDRERYGPGAYYSFIWDLQRPLLTRTALAVAARTPRPRYLDFACGSGRVLAALEPLVGPAVGLDVSPAMVALAAAKVAGAELRIGDILSDPDVVDRDYDLITAFRFFLHADPSVRGPVLASLADRLRDPGSRLVFNVQGVSSSLHGLAAQRPGSSETSMSLASVRRMVRDAGLTIESWAGYGVCPACRERLRPMRRLMRTLDAWAAGSQALRGVSRDVIFVCRPG
jgi:SAM-dependent methyltransferase